MCDCLLPATRSLRCCCSMSSDEDVLAVPIMDVEDHSGFSALALALHYQ